MHDSYREVVGLKSGELVTDGWYTWRRFIHFIQQKRAKRPLKSRDKIQYDAPAISIIYVYTVYTFILAYTHHTYIHAYRNTGAENII